MTLHPRPKSPRKSRSIECYRVGAIPESQLSDGPPDAPKHRAQVARFIRLLPGPCVHHFLGEDDHFRV